MIVLYYYPLVQGLCLSVPSTVAGKGLQLHDTMSSVVPGSRRRTSALH